MNNRTLFKLSQSDDCLYFRTISNKWKSMRFIISKEEWNSFINRGYYVTADINNFAQFILEENMDRVTIRFYWLSVSDNGDVKGYSEIIKIRYSDIAAAIANGEDYRALSIDESNRRPHYEFNCREKLHSVIENKIVKRKFIKVLQNHFHWPDTKTITFYSDSMPYSFFWQEERRDGRRGMCGGLIFHNHDGDLSKAQYSVHT